MIVLVLVLVLMLVLVLVLVMHARLHGTGHMLGHRDTWRVQVAGSGPYGSGHIDGDCLYKECAHLILNRG